MALTESRLSDRLARMPLPALTTHLRAWLNDSSDSTIAQRVAGAAFIIRNHSYRETDWTEFNGLVDKLMASYDLPGKSGKMAAAE